MKKSIVLIVVFCGLTVAQTKEEFRGVWLTNVDSYVLFSDKDIAGAMDYLASAGFNVVFPVVWNKGYTLYPSAVMNGMFGLPILSNFAGRDPLRTVVIEAHRNGLEVIPWFEFGFSTSYSMDGGHIITKYPQWALKDNAGKLVVKNGFDWMSGINPNVQDFVISLFTEVIDNYDIDGVQGDDRLPAMPVEGGYDSVTVSIYKAEHNGADPPTDFTDSGWMRWRANKLNQFFQRSRDSVKARSNHLILSATPNVYPWAYENYLQDSKTWVDNGIVDNFIPQLYRRTYGEYSYELNQALNYVPLSKRDIFFAAVLAKIGSYVIGPELLIDCVNLNRSRNVKGESFFFYEGLRADQNLIGDTLRARFYSQPALLPYRNGSVWRPKALIVNEDDQGAVVSGNWKKISVAGFKPNVLMTNDSTYSSITYIFNVSFSAWYSLYVYLVPNILNSTQAPYTIYSGGDSSIVVFDQKNLKNSGWYKLKDVYLTKGDRNVLKLDNTNVALGDFVLADAAMVMINRKLSPDVVVTSVEDQSRGGIVTLHNFSLSQNYPNPFNSSTQIEYSVSEASFVTLRIYDILGREVSVLVNQEKLPGTYTVSFDATNLASGIYYYRWQAGVLCDTRKMVLVR